MKKHTESSSKDTKASTRDSKDSKDYLLLADLMKALNGNQWKHLRLSIGNMIKSGHLKVRKI